MTKIVANTAILSLNIFVPFTGVFVSFAAVFSDVTQRTSAPVWFQNPMDVKKKQQKPTELPQSDWQLNPQRS